jgi:hypothetical protein
MNNYEFYQMNSGPKYSNPDPFGTTLNISTHEISTLFRHLQTQPSTKRFEVLKTIRKVIKRAGNQLPPVCHPQCFDAIHIILLDDNRPNVLCECLWLVVDIIPSMGPNLDSSMAIILPQIVHNLGKKFLTLIKFHLNFFIRFFQTVY